MHANDDGKITKKATCKEAGEIVYTCSVCGETTTSIIPITEDHKWDAGTVTKAATCTEKGTGVYICTYGCGASKTEEIPALGHDFSGNAEYCNHGCGTRNPNYKTRDPANKLANTLTVKGKTVTIKYADLSKKNITIAAKKAVKVKKAQGKVSYKKKSGDKKITVNKKTGKITVKKGLKKGTYIVKIKVKATGNDTYNTLTKNVKVTIKIA